jgi:hypothetical protein
MFNNLRELGDKIVFIAKLSVSEEGNVNRSKKTSADINTPMFNAASYITCT